jgi:hypothetical protein
MQVGGLAWRCRYDWTCRRNGALMAARKRLAEAFLEMPRWRIGWLGARGGDGTGCADHSEDPIMKLTRTEIACLAEAMQRQDHLLPPPDSLSARARRAALTRLLRAGLAEEVAVADEGLGWRMEAEAPIGLRITAAGLARLDLQELQGETPERDAPRPTKRAIVIALLEREEGARLGDLVAATGWLPHTARAALTGLRKSGIAIETTRDANGTLYRIPAPAHDGEG